VTITCGAFYDDEDRGYSCGLEPFHDPPHREIQDYRTESGGGYLLTFEWWNDWGNDRATGKRWEA
jgi:hypothetical protein